MSMFNRIRDAFRKPEPPAAPTLRNRPGGMAWINGMTDEGCGTGQLVNRIVRTVRVIGGDMWEIDPPQQYVLDGNVTYTSTGAKANRGDLVTIIGVRDACLTPIPGVSDDAKDESLAWLPPVPTRKPEEVA